MLQFWQRKKVPRSRQATVTPLATPSIREQAHFLPTTAPTYRTRPLFKSAWTRSLLLKICTQTQRPNLFSQIHSCTPFEFHGSSEHMLRTASFCLYKIILIDSPLQRKTYPMKDFFDSWQRAAGCVVLVIACGFMGGWIRSLLHQEEEIALTVYDRVHSFCSEPGFISWMAWNDPSGATWAKMPAEWNTQLESIRRYKTKPVLGVKEWSASYRSIVIPLTLLSAALLLSRHRRTSTKHLHHTCDPALARAPLTNALIGIGITSALFGMILNGLFANAFGLLTGLIFEIKSDRFRQWEFWVYSVAGYGTSCYLLRRSWARALASPPKPIDHID